MTHTLAAETLHTPMAIWVGYISIEKNITETKDTQKIHTFDCEISSGMDALVGFPSATEKNPSLPLTWTLTTYISQSQLSFQRCTVCVVRQTKNSETSQKHLRQQVKNNECHCRHTGCLLKRENPTAKKKTETKELGLREIWVGWEGCRQIGLRQERKLRSGPRTSVIGMAILTQTQDFPL